MKRKMFFFIFMAAAWPAEACPACGFAHTQIAATFLTLIPDLTDAKMSAKYKTILVASVAQMVRAWDS